MNDEACKLQHQKIAQDIELINKRLNNHSDRLDSLEKDGVGSKKDIENIFELLKKLEASVEKIADKLELLERSAVNATKLKQLEEEVNQLKCKPADNAEKFKWIIITAITSSCITALIAFLIKK